MDGVIKITNGEANEKEAVSYKCVQCGAPLTFLPGDDKVTCEYCGKKYTVQEIETLYGKPSDKPGTEEREKKAAEGKAGGPAGMAAAREGALRGHKITLVDEGPELGGLYRLCAKIQGRSSIAELLKVQERELVELGVEIIRNTRATAQWIEDNYSGSRILLATGKESCMPDIPGIDTPNVLSLEDLLQGRVPVGHRVAVIGSGNVAVDVTRHLCTHDLKAHDEWCCAWGIGDPAEHIGGTLGVIPHLNPAPRKVYLINETNETTEELFAHERRLYEVQWLRMHGVNIFDEANVEQIDSHSVRVSCEGEEGSTILRVDHIVVVGDREANAELQNELTELGIPFEAAGSMKFKAPFGTAGEAALDGIYVLQALEKRSL